MRTKALLLAAAFAAAGVATSMAQVYSVNAVGYVNTQIDPGFNLVSNPLDAGAGNNIVSKLFANFQGTIPPALKVFVFQNATGGFKTAQWDDADLVFLGEASSLEVTPGNGVFVLNPQAAGSAPLTLTFVGEVPQGTLNNPLPRGFSIKANMVPQAARPDLQGLPGQAGDKVFRYNKATKGYTTYQFDDADNVWLGSGGVTGLPVFNVGEAWFHFRASSAGTWTRTFNVNNPT
jgi:hypothetical protein